MGHEQLVAAINHQEPRIISLGEGKVLMGCAVSPEGVRGICFEPTDKPRPVGTLAEEGPGEYYLKPKDTFIGCTNRESALALLETVKELVASFPVPGNAP